MPRKRVESESDSFIEPPSYLDEVLSRPVRGRKPLLTDDDETIRIISELAKLFCSQSEIAAVLNVSERTLNSFLRNSARAHEAWEDGLQHAKISLRRKQLVLAEKSAPVAIFLGKNYLGQKDEQHNVTTINRPPEEMSEQELLEIAQRAAPADKSQTYN